MNTYDYPQVSGLPTLSAKSARYNAARNHSPTLFVDRANSVHLMRGSKPGNAWMLMLKRDLDLLSRDVLHTITWYASDSAVPTEFKNWVIVDTVAIDVSHTGDTTAAFLVYFEDLRRLFKRSSAAVQYNVRMPAPTTTTTTEDRYYTDTLNAGSLYTWQNIVDDLWDILFEEMPASVVKPTAPALPYTPESTPENLRFIGVSGWDAFCSVLEAVNCTYVYDPVHNVHSIVRLGREQTELTDAITKYASRLTFHVAGDDGYDQLAKMPRVVRVFFRKRITYAGIERDTADANNWELSQWYTKDYSTGATNGFGVLPVWGDIDALYDDQTGPTNSTELTDRANEIGADVASRILYDDKKVANFYAGIISDVIPGSQLERVTIRNYGDNRGTLTEWIAGASVADSMGDVLDGMLRPVDTTHTTRPNYPQYAQSVKITGAWDDTNKVYPAKVCINKTGTWTELDDCFVMPTSKTDIALYDTGVTCYHGPARLSGMISSGGSYHPLYILEDTFPRKPFIDFVLDEDLTTAMSEADATITEEWGPGASAGLVAITVKNAPTRTAGVYKYRGVSGRKGTAVHVSGNIYRIFDMEC